MKLLLVPAIVIAAPFVYAQEEVLSPLLYNPQIAKTAHQLKAGNSIDSTFIYEVDTLDLPVWDDFSINKFVPYNAGYTDGNVTSQMHYHLMDAGNTAPLDPALTFCDSSHAHIDTVSVIGSIGTTDTNYFTTPNSVWVNDLSSYPVTGMPRTLYQECYVIIDSLVDGVWDDDRDTIFYAPDFVQDSAHVFTVDVNDTNLIWVDNYAYHNYHYAVNPWSLGVATLDGVGVDGFPYDFGNTNAHEPADVLTSRPVNLAGKINVFLTFTYQREGYGNAPEINDSLVLDFWLPDSNAWYPSSWYALGDGPTDTWKIEHIAILSSMLDDGFRFRFRNWASTSGNLDHWHIDYVSLEDNQLPTPPTVFDDVAISEPINTLLDVYTSVPWDHFQNADVADKMLDTLKVKVHNSNLAATNYADGELEVKYGGIQQGGSPFVLPNPGVSSGWTGNWEAGMNQYPYPLAANYTFDENVTTDPQATFDVKLNIDAAVSGSNTYEVNDTTYFRQAFKNYYSYDDGSAEAAYGITGSHGLLAYKFEAYEADTLTGVLMHFVPSVDNVSDNTFLLTVWDDNAGQPGTILYQDDYFNTNHPEYSGALNGFRYYTFQDQQSVAVPQTFYVGWEQIDAVSLNIGMDLNIVNNSKNFRNVTGTWVTSSYPGSLMMRPVFSTGLNYTLANPEAVADVESQVSLYPNPASDQVWITGPEDEFTVTVFDMTGRMILSFANETSFDISGFNPGVYLVDIRDQNGLSLYSGKLIKQ